MRTEQATSQNVSKLLSQVEPRVRGAESLEKAAQELVAALQQQFDVSVVITRAFVTVPYGSLPSKNQAFVKNLAESAGAAADLKPATPVLSLIGTYGKETDWRDRRKSKGHVGIPLISASFVDAIPMISRLMKELGVPPCHGWIAMTRKSSQRPWIHPGACSLSTMLPKRQIIKAERLLPPRTLYPSMA